MRYRRIPLGSVRGIPAIAHWSVAGPDEPLTKVLARAMPRAGHDLVVVMDNGILAGDLSAEDVQWAAERGALGLRSGRWVG